MYVCILVHPLHHQIRPSQASCWSPNGQYLMFAMEGDPSLYYLNFPTNDTVGMFVFMFIFVCLLFMCHMINDCCIH